ncbi:MAG: hypothetical protein U0Y68_15945 [Blastocatellia bacterium]
MLLATVMRPLGARLADRVWAGDGFVAVGLSRHAAMAIFPARPMMATFTIGALGMAAATGVGQWRGLQPFVPEYFPQSVGAVTGLVGGWRPRRLLSTAGVGRDSAGDKFVCTLGLCVVGTVCIALLAGRL